MNDMLSPINDVLAAAVERAAASVVQVLGHHRPSAGVVFAPDLILAPAQALDNDVATVRAAGGAIHEAAVLGRSFATGLAVARVEHLGLTPLEVAPDPRVGHLAIAIGRTWSGGVMATVTNVAVIGGPLRTGRASQIDRVIRVAQSPHGALTGGALVDGAGRALGVVTGAAIRGTTVVIPGALAWDTGRQIVAHGGTKQGYLGVSSSSVILPEGQRGGREQSEGLLISAVADGSPAAQGGLFVGDVVLAFDGEAIDDPEVLLMRLRGDRVGRPVTLTVSRGGHVREIAVTVGERPRR